MRNVKIFILGIIIFFIIIIGIIKMSTANSFKITSTDIKQNEIMSLKQVYNGHGCSGNNISPQLSWSGFPQDTQSFAIICHDPDAPRENGWYHWLIVNIPSSITNINSGEKIKGSLETKTSFNENQYGGACPPIGHGVHHYNFTIYALNTKKLEISENTPPVEVEKMIKKHSISQATITGLYERK